MSKKSKVRFLFTKYVKSLKPESNTCYLIRDGWDDYGFKTSFSLIYYDQYKEQKLSVYLRIAEEGQEDGYTKLPDESFHQLPEEFYSLGKSQGYYEEFMGLPIDVRRSILASIRDCAFDPSIFKRFKKEAAFRHSLLRNITLETVERLYSSILSGNISLTEYSFEYQLDKREDKSITVEVSPYSNPPTNVHVLIGRNGVGKTRIISGISDQLSKADSVSKISQPGKIVFSRNEKFANLVAVVFSAFDHFKPPIRNPANKKSIPCAYVGLKKPDGRTFKTLKELKQEFLDSLAICFETTRKDRWIDAISIVNSDPIFNEKDLISVASEDDSEAKIERIFDGLSSGHRIILLTITRLVELVDERTFVLIDEPENHLHPPLLSSFIRAVSNLLIQRNGVALIATHSPVVLQEVPSSCATKIDKINSEYVLNRPSSETYAENIDTLTRDVFRLELEDSGFYKTINDMVDRGLNYDEILEEFDSQIGTEGRAVARSLISIRKNSGNA